MSDLEPPPLAGRGAARPASGGVSGVRGSPEMAAAPIRLSQRNLRKGQVHGLCPAGLTIARTLNQLLDGVGWGVGSEAHLVKCTLGLPDQTQDSQLNVNFR